MSTSQCCESSSTWTRNVICVVTGVSEPSVVGTLDGANVLQHDDHQRLSATVTAVSLLLSPMPLPCSVKSNAC